MTGQSTADERSSLIGRWRERRIDMVVATSAFGLGVDQADVRARLSQAARKTIEASYSLQIWGPRMVALFHSVLSAEQPAGFPEAVALDS